MPIYQIKNWTEIFENDRSKQRDRCSFVCVPNKQHGLGFCRLMAEPDGSSIYGIFHCIAGACSQQKRPREGWLTHNGRAPHGEDAGSPWLVSDLSLKFRRPEQEIQRSLDVLSSASVGWIISHADSPLSNHGVTIESPSSHLEWKGREGKEWKGREGDTPSFEQAFTMTMNVGIPEDFCRLVYDDWSLRGGKDAASNEVPWLGYVVKRWTREQNGWKDGSHNGKHGLGHKIPPWQQKQALETEIAIHPANPSSLSCKGRATPEQRSDLAAKRQKLRELNILMANG